MRYYTIDNPAGGTIAIHPNRRDDLHVECAKSNHLPANKPEGLYGTHVLNIGGGVAIRANAHASRNEAGTWDVTSLYASQYPSGRDLTRNQTERAKAVIGALVNEWAASNEAVLIAAEDEDRSNAGHSLRAAIQRHNDALAILHEELDACDQGVPFNRYPKLPTDR